MSHISVSLNQWVYNRQTLLPRYSRPWLCKARLMLHKTRFRTVRGLHFADAYLMTLQVSIKLRVITQKSFCQMLEFKRHDNTIQHEVRVQTLHQRTETDVCVRFISHCHQKWWRKIAHSLTVTHCWVIQCVSRNGISTDTIQTWEFSLLRCDTV